MFRDAYLDWSRLLAKRLDALAPLRPDGGTEFEPIFVSLTASDKRTDLRDALGAHLMMDPHERASLDARIASPAAYEGLPDEYALYRRIGTPDSEHAGIFRVIDSGMPVRLSDVGTAPSAALPQGAPTGGAPIVAIIDDGIGFLNARFRRANGDGTQTSRFNAVWLQALESSGATGGVTAGAVLDTSAINALFTQGEAAAYARLQAQLHHPQTRAPLSGSVSHGTHVLDLAAGADPEDTSDPVRDWPLLAVQLPPETIDDTSGVWFESYLLQGLRWILRRAYAMDKTAPVIVNLSLGVTAGPKNGTRFIEAQMAREARLWEEVMEQPVRLVWSFGNAYQSDLVAVCQLSNGAADQHLVTRVQPDDATASFVEIRLRDAETSDLMIEVTAPDGTASGFAALAPKELRSFEEKGAAAARIYHVPSRTCGEGIVEAAHYVVAFAPTRPRKPGEILAKPGAWTIGLRYSGSTEAKAIVQVQRDDAIGRSGGRQAYFDAPGAYGWDEVSAEYVAAEAGCPITARGSHNALTTAAARQVFTVGAARSSAWYGAPGHVNYRPSGYSAAGAVWSVGGPTVATLVDHGTFGAGTRAAGTFSGTCKRLGGTSAGAGRLTRALGLSAAKIVANRTVQGTTQTDDLDPEALTLCAVAPERAARLGNLIVEATGSGPGAILPV
jgi:hypothetical protein